MTVPVYGMSCLCEFFLIVLSFPGKPGVNFLHFF